MQRFFLPLLAVLAMLALPTHAEEAKPIYSNTSLQPTALGTQIANDGTALSVTTKWPTLITLDVVDVKSLNIQDKTVTYEAKVKAKDLEGQAFLEMWVDVAGGQYFSRGMDSVVTGNDDWKVIKAPFKFEKGQIPEKFTLNLIINGKGTVLVQEIQVH